MSNRRTSLLGIIGGLMLSENMGDVHDEINHLCDLVGIPRPEGDFDSGWTDGDMSRIERALLHNTTTAGREERRRQRCKEEGDCACGCAPVPCKYEDMA